MMSENYYQVLDFLKETIDTVMNLESSRFENNPSYGWINTKVYPQTGEEKADTDKVFTIIQGRGLEGLAEHLEWYKKFNGYINPKLENLFELGSIVNEKIEKLFSDYEHIPSVVDISGKGNCADTRTSLADLFCARGLYDWYFFHGTKNQVRSSRERLLKIVKDIYSNDSKIFGERMLALGGANLIIRNEKSKQAFSVAKKLINHVLDHHFSNGKWKNIPEGLLIYELDDKNKPLVKDGMVLNSAGNSLEFAGLTAQTLLFTEDLDFVSEEDRLWKKEVVSKLSAIITSNFKLSYKKGFGFYLLTDAVSQKTADSVMPWWKVAEGARACFLVSDLTDKKQDWFMKKGFELLKVFEKKYVGQSPIKIAVQMLDSNGKPVMNVPLNPDIDAGFHTGLSFISVYDSLAKKCKLMLYKAQKEITPQESQLLCGHSARNKPFEYVIDPLFTRILFFKAPYSKSAIVSLDLCEVYDNWCDKLARKVENKLNLAPKSVSISATHTHTGPFASERSHNTSYINYMLKKVLETASEAKKKGKSVDVLTCSAISDFGVNRRFKDKKTGKIIMRPNFQGCIDRQLPVIAFRNDEKKLEAIIYNTAVHPTTIGVSYFAVSADYPGRIGFYLRKEFGEDVVTVPLTGSCGDVRPAVLSDDKQKFVDGTPDDVDRFGKKTAASIIEALKDAKTVKGFADCTMLSVTVPFKLINIPTKKYLLELRSKDAELREKAQRIYDTLSPFEIAHDNPFWPIDLDKLWVDTLLKRKNLDDFVDGKLFAWFINGEIAVFFVPGELFSQIGISIKQLWSGQTSLLASYSNGNLGYMPSKEAIKEGGYEVECSFKDQLFAGPFSENLETELKDGIKNMINDYEGVIKVAQGREK